MAQLIIRKSQAAPSPNLVLVNGYNRALSILRPRPAGNKGPLQGEALDGMPVAPTAQQRIDAQDAPRQASDLTRNLFTVPGERQVWQGVMEEIVRSSRNEADLRRQLFTVVKSSPLPPSVGKTLLRRSVQWWHHRQNRH